MKNYQFKGPENFLKDYKGFLTREEWVEDIIKKYFDECSSEEIFYNDELGYYIKARYKKESYRIYYRKEITLENNKEVIKYRFTTCTTEGDVIKMVLSL